MTQIFSKYAIDKRNMLRQTAWWISAIPFSTIPVKYNLKSFAFDLAMR